jgi:hypothetical protein
MKPVQNYLVYLSQNTDLPDLLLLGIQNYILFFYQNTELPDLVAKVPDLLEPEY